MVSSPVDRNSARVPPWVLPLPGVTHMAPQEEVAGNLLLLQVDFLRHSLEHSAVTPGAVNTGAANTGAVEPGADKAVT